MVKVVLVTGGAGFVGTYVTRKLLADGYKVVVYDQQTFNNVLDLVLDFEPLAGQLVREGGEITDGWRLLDICRRERVDAIVHLAAPLTKATIENPQSGIRDICLGTNTVFALAKQIGAARVVWASSMAVFGPKSFYPDEPVADDAVHMPSDIYGASKSLCEKLARQMYEIDGLDVVGLRLSIVYGAGRLRGYMSYPSHLMRQAAIHRAVSFKYGPQVLHWQYVEEIADMVGTILASSRKAAGRTFNCFGDSRSWHDAAAAIKAARPQTLVETGDEIDPVLNGVVDDFDTKAFATEFGAGMKWPLERGVAATLAIYEKIASKAA